MTPPPTHSNTIPVLLLSLRCRERFASSDLQKKTRCWKLQQISCWWEPVNLSKCREVFWMLRLGWYNCYVWLLWLNKASWLVMIHSERLTWKRFKPCKWDPSWPFPFCGESQMKPVTQLPANWSWVAHTHAHTHTNSQYMYKHYAYSTAHSNIHTQNKLAANNTDAVRSVIAQSNWCILSLKFLDSPSSKS